MELKPEDVLKFKSYYANFSDKKRKSFENSNNFETQLITSKEYQTLLECLIKNMEFNKKYGRK